MEIYVKTFIILSNLQILSCLEKLLKVKFSLKVFIWMKPEIHRQNHKQCTTILIVVYDGIQVCLMCNFLIYNYEQIVLFI